MRKIYIVNAAQVVVSDAHPEGSYSIVPGYPKTFDSRDYDATEANPNGSEEKAHAAAKSEYYSRLFAKYDGSGTRVMWTVTLRTADGRTLMAESRGAFPDMTPAPEPEEPEEEPTEPIEGEGE